MPVATWGYGTGATGTGTHPFSLSIQGPDFISWVPIETIRVSTSVDSNATLEFDIVEPSALGTAPFVPHALADIRFTDNANAVTVFAGIVVGVEEIGLGVGTGRRVRAVDYGYLLDVCPMKRGIIAGYIPPPPVVPPPGDFATYLYEPILSIMGQAATSGAITAGAVIGSEYGPSGSDHRVLRSNYVGEVVSIIGYVPDDAGTGDPINAGSLRGNLDTVTSRARLGTYGLVIEPFYSTAPIATYVDPEGRLNVHPINLGWTSAPFEVDNDTTAGTALKTQSIQVERDYTALMSGVFVSDSNSSSGGDNSAFYVADTAATNGYYLCPDSTDAPLASSSDVAAVGERYLSNAGHEIYSGSLVVVDTHQARIGTYLTVTDARFGLSDTTVVIQSVDTQFLPGSSGARVMEITFIPKATVAGRSKGGAQRTVRSSIAQVTTAWTVP